MIADQSISLLERRRPIDLLKALLQHVDSALRVIRHPQYLRLVQDPQRPIRVARG